MGASVSVACSRNAVAECGRVWLAQEPKTARGAKQREAELHYQQIAAAQTSANGGIDALGRGHVAASLLQPLVGKLAASAGCFG